MKFWWCSRKPVLFQFTLSAMSVTLFFVVLGYWGNWFQSLWVHVHRRLWFVVYKAWSSGISQLMNNVCPTEPSGYHVWYIICCVKLWLYCLSQQRHVINSLWPSDTIWRYVSGSKLTQAMACCLTAPSHYLNQCWLIISMVQWHPSEINFTRDTSAISHWN